MLRQLSSTPLVRSEQPIRRLHDPAAALANAGPAIAYINAQGKILLNGLTNSIKAAGGRPKKVDDVLNIALKLGDPAALPNPLDAAAKALLISGAAGQAALPQPGGVAELAVRALNYAEREITTSNALGQDVRKVKIGTEFSFGDGKPASDAEASVNIKVAMPEAPRGEQPEQTKKREATYGQPRTRALERIAAWAKAAENNADKIPGKPTVVATGHVGKATFAKKITYTFTEPKEWTWYWVVDIDEACYETQTKPTSVSEFENGPIKEIINEHIFKGAAEVKLQEEARPRAKGNKKSADKPEAPTLGLRPDPTSTGGGGHLSFDLGTAFGDENGAISVELMLTTLGELQQNADDLAREFRKDTKGRRLTQPTEDQQGTEPVPLDVANAPSLSAQRLKLNALQNGLDGYTTLVETINTRVLQGSTDDLPAIHAELVAFNQTLTNPEVLPGERKDHVESAANISHYQAINIEHLGDDEASSRRVEIRDIPAQTDYAKFLRDLKVLVDALGNARQTVKNAQSARLT